MLDSMDLDIPYGTPGGDSFEDVTALLVEAAKDMASEELLMTDGFTLMDAMSAFEIGEPRMDSGMTLEQDVVGFNPLAPLLPEELCWILDRMFACEMEWHAGNTLSQSVFTLLYVHQLADINPDLLPPDYPFQNDPQRPIEFITVVLRAAIFGLLKCCDFVWRELSKKRVYDVEDWQSDKCDVTLLEGVPADVVLRKLDDASKWLRHSQVPAAIRDALCDRLLLRKTLLELFRFNQTEELDDLLPLVTIAKNLLRRVRHTSPSTPPPGSPALNVFDPRVTRRLHTIAPIRPLVLPEQEVVWQSLTKLLDGWEHVARLREAHTLRAWKVAGVLDVCSPKQKSRYPYIRSLTQVAFCDRNIVLGEYPLAWLVNQFFDETLGIPYHHILNVLPDDWMGHGRWTVKDVETQLIKTVVNFIKFSWYNGPRRRRALMRSINDWQIMHEALLALSAQVAIDDHEGALIAVCLPRAAVLWKLTVAEEIVLSGFQLELYAPHERSVAYWLLAHILEDHIDCMETLRSFMLPGTAAHDEMCYHSSFLSALQLMSLSLCALTARDLSQSMERMALNFARRYKWIPADQAGVLLMPLPSFIQFPSDLKTLFDDETFVPIDHLKSAQSILLDLTERRRHADSDERVDFIENLASVAGELAASLLHANASTPFIWDTDYHPWFPRCRS